MSYQDVDSQETNSILTIIIIDSSVEHPDVSQRLGNAQCHRAAGPTPRYIAVLVYMKTTTASGVPRPPSAEVGAPNPREPVGLAARVLRRRELAAVVERLQQVELLEELVPRRRVALPERERS